MKFLFSVIFLLCICVHNVRADDIYVDISAEACEKIIQDESKSSARLRASDKAVFTAVKKMHDLEEDINIIGSDIMHAYA